MGQSEIIMSVVAAVIAGLVLLSMASVQLRGQEASIDSAQYRASKARMLDVAEIMQRDFGNMGAHMYKLAGGGFEGRDTEPDTVVLSGEGVWDAPAGPTSHLEFWTQQDSMAPPVRVRYEWRAITGETVTLNDGTTRQLLRVQRFVDGDLTTESELITRFEVDVLTDSLVTIALHNLDRIRVVEVAVSAVSPLGKGDYIEETLFEANYRPLGMTIWDDPSRSY